MIGQSPRRARTRAAALASAMLAFGFLAPNPSAGGDTDARRIMERVNARARPSAAVQRVRLRIEGKIGGRVTWELIVYQADDGIETKRLFTVVAPDEIRGLSVLRVERESDEAQWVHVNGMPEPTRATVLNPGLPFFGTDFTFGDIVERFHLDAYTFRLLGEGEWRRRPCYIVAATVLDERLGYRSVVGWIDRERWLVLKAKYRDLRKRPLKIYWADRVQDVDGFWTPYIRTMREVTERKRTAFEVLAIADAPAFPPDLFMPAAMHERRGLCYPSPCSTK